jgi:hypothetical protein
MMEWGLNRLDDEMDKCKELAVGTGYAPPAP